MSLCGITFECSLIFLYGLILNVCSWLYFMAQWVSFYFFLVILFRGNIIFFFETLIGPRCKVIDSLSIRNSEPITCLKIQIYIFLLWVILFLWISSISVSRKCSDRKMFHPLFFYLRIRQYGGYYCLQAI